MLLTSGTSLPPQQMSSLPPLGLSSSSLGGSPVSRMTAGSPPPAAPLLISSSPPPPQRARPHSAAASFLERVLVRAGAEEAVAHALAAKRGHGSGAVERVEAALLDAGVALLAPRWQYTDLSRELDLRVSDALEERLNEVVGDLLHADSHRPRKLLRRAIALSQVRTRALRFAAVAELYLLTKALISTAEVAHDATGYLSAVLAAVHDGVLAPRLQDIDLSIRQASVLLLHKIVWFEPTLYLGRASLGRLTRALGDTSAAVRAQAARAVLHLASAGHAGSAQAILAEVAGGQLLEMAGLDGSPVARRRAAAACRALIEAGHMPSDQVREELPTLFKDEVDTSTQRELAFLFWAVLDGGVAGTDDTSVRLADLLHEAGTRSPAQLEAITVTAPLAYNLNGLLEFLTQTADARTAANLLPLVTAWLRAPANTNAQRSLSAAFLELLTRFEGDECLVHEIILLFPLISPVAAGAEGRDENYRVHFAGLLDVVVRRPGPRMVKTFTRLLTALVPFPVDLEEVAQAFAAELMEAIDAAGRTSQAPSPTETADTELLDHQSLLLSAIAHFVLPSLLTPQLHRSEFAFQVELATSVLAADASQSELELRVTSLIRQLPVELDDIQAVLQFLRFLGLYGVASARLGRPPVDTGAVEPFVERAAAELSSHGNTSSDYAGDWSEFVRYIVALGHLGLLSGPVQAELRAAAENDPRAERLFQSQFCLDNQKIS